DPPSLSPAAGFYTAPVRVTVTPAEGTDALTCTLDGSVPTQNGEDCSAPFAIDAASQPVVVRARAFVDGLWPSRMATSTYSTDTDILDGGVTVISLVV